MPRKSNHNHASGLASRKKKSRNLVRQQMALENLEPRLLLASDVFATATDLGSALVASDTGNNAGFTGEVGEVAQSGGTNSAWWQWTAPGPGALTVDTFGSNFDTFLTATTGPTVDSTTTIAANDDTGGFQSQVAFAVVPGTTYQFAVDGFGGATGDITFNLNFAPQNDDFADRTDIGSSFNISLTGNNAGYTGEAGEFAQSAAINSSWFTWTAPVSGDVVVDTIGSALDTFLTVATGSAVNALTVIGQNDDIDGGAGNFQSIVAFTAVAGTEYQFAIDGWNTDTDAFVFNFDFTPRNDDFAFSRDEGTVSAFTDTSNNVGFTGEVGEPAQSGAINSAWWSWIAPLDGNITVDTLGSGLSDTFLTILTGSAVNALTVVDSNDDIGGGNFLSEISTAVTGGTTYHFAVDGFGSAVGDITINLVFSTDCIGLGNDCFGDRVDLASVVSTTVSGNNNGYLDEPGEPAQSAAINSAWYSWTAPEAGRLNIDTVGSALDTFLTLATGPSVGGLTVLAQNDDIDGGAGNFQSAIEFFVAGGVEYQIGMDGWNTDTGSFDLNLLFTPSNDNFANRIDLGSASISDTGTNVAFTAETGEPAQSGAVTSAWWSWTAPLDGTVVADTIGSGHDTFLTATTGSAVNALTVLEQNDDIDVGAGNFLSEVTIPVVAGTEYQFAVDGWMANTGTIVLNLDFVPVCTTNGNDCFDDAIDLGTASTANDTGTNVGYTDEGGEPGQNGDINSAWWQWTAPADGSVAVNTFGSGFDTFLTGTTGATVDTLTVLASNDDTGGLQSQVSFNVTNGTTYQFAVDGFAAATGSIELNLAFTPFNDDFVDRINLDDAFPLSVPGTNVGFTGEIEEPDQNGAINSAWWSWTAPDDGLLDLDTFGSSFDTFLTIATGTVVDDLLVLAQNDDSGGLQSAISLPVSAGVEYFFSVDGFAAAQGSIILNLAFEPLVCVSNDCFDDRIDLGSDVSITTTGSNVDFLVQVGEPAQSGEIHSAWWSWTAPGRGFLTVDTVGSALDTFLTVGTGSSVDTLTLIDQNDDIDAGAGNFQSSVTIDIDAGVEYQIAVDGRQANQGGIVLNLEADLIVPTVIELQGNDLLIQDRKDTGNDDNLRIEFAAGEYIITDIGTELAVDLGIGTQVSANEVRVPIASFTGGIIVDTVLGDDSLTLGTTIVGQGRAITFDGGVGNDSHSVDGVSVTDFAYDATGAGSGSFTFDGESSTFSNVESTTLATVDATNVTVSASDGVGRDVVISDGGVDYVGLSTFTFTAPSGTMTVNASGGDDSIKVGTIDAGLTNLTVDGGGGNDTTLLAVSLPLGLNDLTVTSDQIQVANGGVTTIGQQTFNGNVGLLNDTNFDGSGVAFNGDVDSLLVGPELDSIVNGSFETGAFSGWQTADIAGPFFALQVAGAGVTTPFDFGFFESAPSDGAFAAAHGFDGTGPGTIRIAQDVSVADVTSVLSFDYRAAWDMVTFCGGCSLDRMIEVNIEDLAGNNLETIPVLTAAAGTANPDTGDTMVTIDLAAYLGTDIRIGIDSFIPEVNTGPAFVQIDNVSLLGVNAGAPSNLVVNTTGSGTTTFGGTVGGAAPLASVTTNADGTTELSGAINADTVDFLDGVAVTGDSTVTSPAISFAAGVQGPAGLTVDGDADFAAAVGDTTPVGSLTSVGTVHLTGGAVTTSGGQDYQSVVDMPGDTTFTGNGIHFVNPLDGAVNVDINDSGVVQFDAAVGSVTPLASLDLNSGGPLTLAVNITTAGDLNVTVTDTSSTGDDLIVGATTLTSSAGAISVGGGDNTTVETTASLLAATGVTVAGDVNAVDQGSQIRYYATVDSIPLTILGGPGSDNIWVNDTNGTVENITNDITVNGGGGSDNLTLDDSADGSGDTVVVDGTTVQGLVDSGSTINHADLEAITINGGTDADTFDMLNVGGSLAIVRANGGAGDDIFNSGLGPVQVDMNGGSPAIPASPGDTMNLTIPTQPDPFIFAAETNGTFLSDGNAPVNWSSIETFTINGDVFTAGDLFIETADRDDRIIFSLMGLDELQVRINTIAYGPFTVSGNVVVEGNEGNDRMSVAGNINQAVDLRGGPGRDALNGGRGDDFFDGGDGNDIILTGEGNNSATGGDGNDTISARSGNDTLDGGIGNDRLAGFAGDDVLRGEEGNDQLTGGNNNDVLAGGAGNDILHGGSEIDVLFGNNGNDILIGDTGNDFLVGGTGDDGMRAQRGSDSLVGGFAANGDDWLAQIQLLSDFVASGDISSIGLLSDDGDTDALNGGSGPDNFFLGINDNLVGLRPSDNLQSIT